MTSSPAGLPAGVPDVVPLFPLPEHVLLPGLPVPYRVFEPRYRALVEDLLALTEMKRWLAIPRLAPGWEPSYHAAPPIVPVATVGRMLSCSTLRRGHYLISVRGMHRLRLQETASTHPYRLARVHAWPDLDGDGGSERIDDGVATVLQLVDALRPHLGTAAADLGALVKQSRDADTLVYRLSSVMIADVDERERLLTSQRLIDRIHQLQRAIAGALAVVTAPDENNAPPASC
ncbi:MAG: LON peptidase substrate-binding domain-containing protein [Acidobacteriota bacterium]|nr:MAG: LON peptidase substrate-binding domain-containing protein [Acidobacteriota bacterium]